MPKVPFIIMREKNSKKTTKLLEKVQGYGIQYSAFMSTMTEGAWQYQAAHTLGTKLEEIILYGIIL
jgi:CRISPR/Cas system-associated endoribonuclease Cas2